MRSQTSRAPLIDVPDRSPCQGVSDFRCPAMDLSCPGEDPGACLEESRDDLPGWCEVHSGAERCVAGAPSAAYLSYCRVEACYGADFDACVAEADCAPTVCEQIDAIAADCPGYAFDCPETPAAQASCFLDLLKLLAEEAGDVCFMFDTTEILCSDSRPTVEAFGSCVTQECFGLTTYGECMASFEILCSYTP